MKTNWMLWPVLLPLAFIPCLSACADSVQPQKPPISLAFQVQKAGGKVETELMIVERQTYGFILQYSFREDDQTDRTRIWRLAGGAIKGESGRWIELGAPLQIKLRVVRKFADGVQSVYEEEISNPRLTSWGRNSLNARLANVMLEPGSYLVSAESLISAPELSEAKVRLNIARAYLGK